MNKTPLNLAVALVVARELTLHKKFYYVSYNDGVKQNVIMLAEHGDVVCIEGNDLGLVSILGSLGDAHESVRIVRKGSGWGPEQTMKGWQAHAEADRRLKAGKPVRVKIEGTECEYRDEKWRLVDLGRVGFSVTHGDYSVQWPDEEGGWEDVTEEALMAYVDMVVGE